MINGFSLPATGTYYIVATRFGGAAGSSTGSYTLSLSMGAVSVAPPVGVGSFATFDCNGTMVDATATVTFEQVRPGFSYRVTVLGLDGLDPVIGLFAADGSSLCNDDEPGAAGSVVDVPGVGVVSADQLTSQVNFTTSGAIGDIEMLIGGYGGSGGRFVAIFEGLAIAPSNELDAATIAINPAVQNNDVYVYMISQYASLDPYMQLPARGLVCDDIGTGGCVGVPPFTGGGVSIANGGTYITGQFDAGIGIVPGSSAPLTFQFQSYAGSTAGNYAMILMGSTPGGPGAVGPGPAAGVAGLDFSLAPNYGTQSLTAGFTPDPYTVNMTSGGSADIYSAVGSICQGIAAGYATAAPDFRLQYTAGGFPLQFAFTGDGSGDTTMVVNAPDGQWYCDDDSAGSLNPMVSFSSPPSGQYDIWIGSYAPDTFVSGVLAVSETGAIAGGQGAVGQPPVAQPPAAGVAGLDFSLAPNYGSQSLTAGFTPDPYTVNVTSGGSVDVSMALGNQCQGPALGYAASAPDFRLQYTAGGFPLRFQFASGQGDTTMIVNAPDGTWYCDDDSAGSLNPMVSFASPLSGQYDIWIGSYAPDTYIAGTLSVTESFVP